MPSDTLQGLCVTTLLGRGVGQSWGLAYQPGLAALGPGPRCREAGAQRRAAQPGPQNSVPKQALLAVRLGGGACPAGASGLGCCSPQGPQARGGHG